MKDSERKRKSYTDSCNSFVLCGLYSYWFSFPCSLPSTVTHLRRIRFTPAFHRGKNSPAHPLGGFCLNWNEFEDRRRKVYTSFEMATFLEHAYSMVHQDNTADQPTLQELKTQLEKGTDESKVESMKRILTIMLNGDAMPQLLMHIIRFVMPSKSKPLKKLLYFYYEICPKLDAQGKLKQEMILVWLSPLLSVSSRRFY